MSAVSPSASKVAATALSLTKDAVLIAGGDYAGAAAMLPDIVSLLEQLVVLLPPVDAPDLDPGDRATADAQAQGDLERKFGK